MLVFIKKKIVTSSNCYDILEKLNRLTKWGGEYVDLFALKYGRSAQHHAGNCFYEVVKPKHKNVKRRDFCLPACHEIKCLNSINFTSQICMKMFHYFEIKKTWLSTNKINTTQSVLCRWVLQSLVGLCKVILLITSTLNLKFGKKWTNEQQDIMIDFYFHVFLTYFYLHFVSRLIQSRQIINNDLLINNGQGISYWLYLGIDFIWVFPCSPLNVHFLNWRSLVVFYLFVFIITSYIEKSFMYK